jgi:hypothetical protein
MRFAERYRRPLFGVRLGEPPPDNEMLQVLSEGKHPVFDLGHTEQVEQLMKLLRQHTGGRWPERPEPPNPEWLFRSALRALDQIEADYPLTDRDRHWFVNELARRYNVHR